MSRWSPARPPTATCRRCWCRSKLGNTRVTGLDDRQTDQTFETEFTARSNPHRGYITIIEGCDKFCAYCVVPYTRGKERSRTSQSVLDEARRMADAGYTDIQLLGQNVNSYRDPAGKKTFAELLVGRRRAAGHPPRALYHLASARLHQGHRRRHRLGADALRSRASAGAERLVARAAVHVPRVHARAVPGAHRLDEGRAQPRDQHHHRHHRRLPGRNRRRVRARPSACWTRSATTACSPSSTRPGRTRPRCNMPTRFRMPRSRAACRFCRSISAKSSGSSYRRHLGRSLK